MRNRRKKTMRRVIPVTPGANAYLNAEAEKLGISGAEYARRMLFLGGWAGIVFDDCRAIEAEAAAEARARKGLPAEEYLPYKRSVMARLRQGIEEIRQHRAFVLESILPDLDADEARLIAALQEVEKAADRFTRWVDIGRLTRKISGEESS
jgi:hypothetical protein